MKVELKGIEIVMGDKLVKLTIEESQELRKQLNELFGEKITYIPVPSTPIIIERDTWPWWRPYGPYYTGDPILNPQPTETAPIPPLQVYCCTDSNVSKGIV